MVLARKNKKKKAGDERAIFFAPFATVGVFLVPRLEPGYKASGSENET
ncbi:MAG: hypothetical protein R6U22_08495 [Desulfohalobiaceae bacterium]